MTVRQNLHARADSGCPPLGLAIVTALASRDDTIVFAGARNPSAATDLHALVEKYPGKVHLVKLVSGDRTGNEAAVAHVKAVAGRLDVVIANAGSSSSSLSPYISEFDTLLDRSLAVLWLCTGDSC